MRVPAAVQDRRTAAAPGGRCRPVALRFAAAAAALGGWLAAAPAATAQTAGGGGGEAATIAELRRQLEEMRRRLERLEARAPGEAQPAAGRRPAATARAPGVSAATAPGPPAAQDAAESARAAAEDARAARRSAEEARQAAAAAAAAPPQLQTEVPGLLPPEPMGREIGTEDALRSDLPGIAIRIPRTDTQVRLYGFAKLTAWSDLNGRNQTDAPAPALIPLTGGPADLQGGDFGMTARFSRLGVDTRTLTRWGTLETRIEGDFGGGAPTSSNAVFRLRQAWAELGTEVFRVLVGQANSLWNEGLFETLIDATNLNQSFIRQAQIRATGRLARGLTGQVSVEAPETNYASAAGLFNPGSTLGNGASPAFNAWPDLHGRLTYQAAGWELGLRAMLRGLELNTNGTAAPGPPGSSSATAFGLAAHVRVPMRLVSARLGPDELIGMGYYGEGIGRYFFGSTGGLDAVSNLGLPGVQGRASLDAVPTWGLTAAYRRFWMPQLRSNFAYSYARQDFPGYALGFAPGSAAALALNRDVQQVFANLIWSPFAEQRADGAVGTGWLDVGLEYLFTRRDIFGGGSAAGPGGVGHGIANRLLLGAVARF